MSRPRLYQIGIRQVLTKVEALVKTVLSDDVTNKPLLRHLSIEA